MPKGSEVSGCLSWAGGLRAPTSAEQPQPKNPHGAEEGLEGQDQAFAGEGGQRRRAEALLHLPAPAPLPADGGGVTS